MNIVHKEALDKMREHYHEIEYRMLVSTSEDWEKRKKRGGQLPDTKLALVKIGQKTHVVHMNVNTLIAYKGSYRENPVWMERKYTAFIRWATSFDL